MRSHNNCNNNNKLFSSKETMNTTDKIYLPEITFADKPNSVACGSRAPFDSRFPIMPKIISYQLQAETNFRIRTLRYTVWP
jgi:hypothetical protein